jgi:DNA-binding winged helix-turn-helix (wHTH) protein
MSYRYRFGPYEVDPTTQRLLYDGQPVKLPGRALQLLLHLIERRHRVVGKAELADLLWPRRDSAELARLVLVLRKLLGSEVVATLPGHGWRFMPALEGEVNEPLRLVPAQLPPNADAPLLPGELPRPHLRPLLGREADFAALAAMLPERRWLSLVGEPGVGKTQLAAHLLAHRPGVAWVDLSRLPSTADARAALATAVAQTFGAHHPTPDPLADLAHGLRLLDAPGGLWLVLDDADPASLPLEAAAGVVQVLLDAAPSLRVLWLGTQALPMAGESAYRLRPLPVPPADADAALARQSAALRLLLMQARRVERHFEIDLRDESACAAACRLVRHLHGVPMAVELAGARLPTLGAERVLLELQQQRGRAAGAPMSALAETADWTLPRRRAAWRGVARAARARRGPPRRTRRARRADRARRGATRAVATGR